MSRFPVQSSKSATPIAATVFQLAQGTSSTSGALMGQHTTAPWVQVTSQANSKNWASCWEWSASGCVEVQFQLASLQILSPFRIPHCEMQPEDHRLARITFSSPFMRVSTPRPQIFRLSLFISMRVLSFHIAKRSRSRNRRVDTGAVQMKPCPPSLIAGQPPWRNLVAGI